MIIPQFSFNLKTALTAAQMLGVDNQAVKFGLGISQMMELAAFHMASLVRFTNAIADKQILIFAGSGNNGADAIATARFLQNLGAKPQIITNKANVHGQHHLNLAKNLKIPIIDSLQLIKVKPDLIIDGILGYSIKGEVRQPYRDWINHINDLKLPTYAFDLPSGSDPVGGSIHGVAVKATHTLTLAYPKQGLFTALAKPYVGHLYLADIGIPKAVYQKLKLDYQNPFTKSSLVKLTI